MWLSVHVVGLTENVGRETKGRNCRHEIAGHENAGHENVIPLLHDETGSTSWLNERTTSARRALVEPARRASFIVYTGYKTCVADIFIVVVAVYYSNFIHSVSIYQII